MRWPNEDSTMAMASVRHPVEDDGRKPFLWKPGGAIRVVGSVISSDLSMADGTGLIILVLEAHRTVNINTAPNSMVKAAYKNIRDFFFLAGEVACFVARLIELVTAKSFPILGGFGVHVGNVSRNIIGFLCDVMPAFFRRRFMHCFCEFIQITHNQVIFYGIH